MNLELHEGEFVALMGPSGSGKTTLLRLLAGLGQPDSGDICLGSTSLIGLRDRDLAAFRRENLGLVFQASNLLPQLTASENVALPAVLAGHPKSEIEKRVSELMLAVELHGFERRYPDELSGGEQQRVAIARSIVNSPIALLADEPTGNLDLKTSETVCELLVNVNKQGYGILVATHSPFVAKHAQRVAFLFDGQIVEWLEGPVPAEAIGRAFISLAERGPERP